MRKTALPIFIILFSILTGCASPPIAPLEKDMEAKQFIVPNGKSNIYLYRNTILGFQKSMSVSLDNKRAGKTGANTLQNGQERGFQFFPSKYTSELRLMSHAGHR